MRRLICLLAALGALAGPLATASRAVAEDHGRHEQGGGRQGMGRIFGGGGRAMGPPAYRGGEGGYRGQEYRPQEYRQPEYRQAPPQEYRQEYRPQEYRPQDGRGEDPRYTYRGQTYAPPQRADPRYDPRGYATQPNSAPRRGGYMGQGAPVISDYDRYRLRPPPPGYDWVQTSRGAALVSRSTRQVFDVVPY